MAIADVGIHPVDHPGNAHALHHHVERMVVHVHERIGTAAEFGRTFGDQIERLAQAGQRTVLDPIGDDREHSIEQRRVGGGVADWRISARNLAQARAGRIEFVESRLCADERKKCHRESLERVRKAAYSEQRTTRQPLHDEERRTERTMVSLEDVRARDGIPGGEQAIDSGVLARAFGVGGGALVEAQDHRYADRNRREPLRCSFEREIEDRGFPSAGKHAQARDRRPEVSG